MQSSNPILSIRLPSPLTDKLETTSPQALTIKHRNFARSLGLFDSVMMVVGAMIGSGIFIVPAETARNVGSPGWLLAAWAFAGLLTVAAALSYGELASMMPEAGGMYVFLREAWSPASG